VHTSERNGNRKCQSNMLREKKNYFQFDGAWHVLILTFLWSGASTSHIDATIFETSPNDAFGFWPLIEAWVSRKNRAYADTGLGNKKEREIH
jgi:hypothetical protein